MGRPPFRQQTDPRSLLSTLSTAKLVRRGARGRWPTPPPREQNRCQDGKTLAKSDGTSRRTQKQRTPCDAGACRALPDEANEADEASPALVPAQSRRYSRSRSFSCWITLIRQQGGCTGRGREQQTLLLGGAVTNGSCACHIPAVQAVPRAV